MSLYGAGAPQPGEAGGDGAEVLAEEAGEALDRLRGILLGLADLLQQQASAPMTYQVGADSASLDPAHHSRFKVNCPIAPVLYSSRLRQKAGHSVFAAAGRSLSIRLRKDARVRDVPAPSSRKESAGSSGRSITTTSMCSPVE